MAKKSSKKSSNGVNFKQLSAQRKQKQAKRGKGKDVVLPDGFRVVGRAPSHDFDKHPVLEGERGETKTVEFKEGKNVQERRCCVVVSEEFGAVTLWESAGLRDFFDGTEEGDYIRVEQTGELPAQKKGHNPMRVFSCAVRE